MSHFYPTYSERILNYLRASSQSRSSKKILVNSKKRKLQQQKSLPIQMQRPRDKQKTITYIVQDPQSGKKQIIVNNNMFLAQYKKDSLSETDCKQIIVNNSQNLEKRRKSQKQKSKVEIDQSLILIKEKGKDQQKIKGQNRIYSQQIQYNTYPFVKKRSQMSQMNTKSKLSKEERRQKLIKSVQNEKQSQRLQMIFESSRKVNKTQSFQGSKVESSRESKILNRIKVDQVSRTILRKSFCFRMIEDDDEWQRVVSNSKKKWNDENEWNDEREKE